MAGYFISRLALSILAITMMCVEHHLYVNGQALTDNFLVMTDSYNNNVYQVSLSTGQTNRLFTSRPSGANPVAVTFDPINNVVYLSDNGVTKSISKYSLATSTYDTIYTDSNVTAFFDGITMDPSAQVIYYADAGFGRIGQMSTDGTGHRIICERAGSLPRAIVHDRTNRLLYWTDWSSTFPAIYRAPVDTGESIAVISGNLAWPNALAIDFYTRVMYWGDGGLHKIEMANLDGTGRTVLIQSATAHYYGMSLDATYLYYTDWTLSNAVKMNRQTLTSSVVISTTSFGRLNAIVQYNSTDRNTIGNVIASPPPILPVTSRTTTFGMSASSTTANPITTQEAQRTERENNNSYQPIQGWQQTDIIIAAIVVAGLIIISIAIVIGCVRVYKYRIKRNAAAAAAANKQRVVYAVPPPSYVNSGFQSTSYDC